MLSWQARALEIFLRLNRLVSGNSGDLDVAKERAEVESLAKLFKPVGGIRCEPVDADGVPAEWIIPEREQAGRVILFLHGGSFNSGSITSHRTLAGNVAWAARARALLIDYRLAPEHPFPAALEDARRAYGWLLSQGFVPNQVLIAGDSAGGTLTLNLLLDLRQRQQPQPRAAVCLSPAPDLTFSSESWSFNARRDLMLIAGKEHQSVKIYLREVDPRSPQASPVFADLHSLPPLLIQVGSYELLLSDARRFAEKAEAAGGEVTLEVWEGMQHEWQFAASFLPEGRRALESISRFVENNFA